MWTVEYVRGISVHSEEFPYLTDAYEFAANRIVYNFDNVISYDFPDVFTYQKYYNQIKELHDKGCHGTIVAMYNEFMSSYSKHGKDRFDIYQSNSEYVPINVCKKCNGTGVMDLELYKRTCDCKLG